ARRSADGALGQVRPRATRAHSRELAATLEAARPESTTDASRALHELAEQVKTRGIVVIVSDLHDDPERIARGLRHLRFRRHEVILFHVLDGDELELPYRTLVELEDLETRERVRVQPAAFRAEYLRAIDEHAARIRRECSSMRI